MACLRMPVAARLYAVLLGLCLPLAAEYAAWVPSEFNKFSDGTAIRNADRTDDLSVSGEHVSTQVTTVSGQSFTQGLKIQVTRAAPAARDISLRIPTSVALTERGSFAITFWARAVSGPYAQLEAVLETRGDPPVRSLSKTAAPLSEWRQYTFTGMSAIAAEAGSTSFGFDFGSMVQTLEIGGIECIYYGSNLALKKIDDLETEVYAGREATHPWRQEALARIDSLRKADYTITVTREGQPCSGATVTVTMRTHAFGFSTAVQAAQIAQNNTSYKNTLRTIFNKGGLENYLKWSNLVEPRIDTAEIAVNWMHAQGMRQRGHVLVWPSLNLRMPDWLSSNPDVLAGQITDHITETVARFKGKINEWDVINELYGHHTAVDLLGKQAMVDWFTTAHAADSACILYINDNDIIVKNNPAHRDFYHETVQYLLDNGAPLHGIGFQGHFRSKRLLSPIAVLTALREFDRYGLDLQVTEFDFYETDNALQAEFTRDILIAVFSHPTITGYQMWGFWQGAHRGSADHLNGYMYDLGWDPKPNADAYNTLVFSDWWTDTEGTTDQEGRFSFRGFKGTYAVTISCDGDSRTVEADLSTGGGLTIPLEGGGVVGTFPKPDIPCKLPRVCATRAGVRCTVPSHDAYTVTVYDLCGRQLTARRLDPGTTTLVRYPEACSVLLVRMVTPEGKGSVCHRITPLR